jgi:putative component of toxin-antitoxin plasmid stabilization module
MVAAGLDSNKTSDVALEACWRHDVICGQAIEFVRVSDDYRNLGHGLERLRIELGRTACDQDFRRRPTTARVPDRLPRLAYGLVGDGAAVDHDPVLARGRGARNRIALGKVEAAA